MRQIVLVSTLWISSLALCLGQTLTLTPTTIKNQKENASELRFTNLNSNLPATASKGKNTLSCGTVSPTLVEKQAMEARYQRLVRQARSARLTTTQFLPVRYTLINKADGTGEIASIKEVNQNLAILNRDFAPMNLQFYLVDVREIKDDNHYNHISSEANNTKLINTVPNNAINIFVCNDAYVGNKKANGFASYPTANLASTIIVIRRITLNYAVISHEMGHYFNLYHTFENSGHQDVSKRELVNGSNCATAGDQICDTPADPYELIDFGHDDFFYDGCKYIFKNRDANGELFMPLYNNIMSYYFGGSEVIINDIGEIVRRSCGQENFTRGQFERMKRVCSLNCVSGV